MRLSVTQLRVGILVGNLVLAGGVLGYAALSYTGLTNQQDDYKPLDLAKLERGLTDAAPRPVASSQPMQASALRLLPTKVQPITDPGTGTTEPEDTTPVATGEGEYQPGPLEDAGYLYVQYMLRADPLDNFVILAKDDGQGGASPRITSSYAARRVTTTTRRITTSSRRPTTARPTPGNRISFSVRQRQFTDKELDLDFMIHSADENRFVYWIPGAPSVKYALEYQKPEGILREPDLGLRPLVEESAEGEEGAEEEKSHFVVYPRDVSVERELEKEYTGLLEGGRPGRVLEARRGTDTSASSSASRPVTAAAPSGGGAPQPGAAPPSASRGAPGGSSRGGSSTYRRVTPGARPEPRTTPTAEEAESLRQSMEKMTPEQRQQMEEALRGGRR